MPAPQQILDLIARFERDRDRYAAGQYNETELRREYLDPFFRALGWDIDNSQGYSERYKQVIHQDSIRVAGKAAAPDYAFRIGGVRKFFVEAKKPAVNLRENVSPAYQLRRYGWSAKLPLSILTNFEEFAVYDCRIRPNRDDKASQARIMYLTYKDYPARWDELVGLFSPDAIMRGAFDAYAESQKPRRGTAEVDDAFLTEMDEWRVMLARNLALRNPALTQRQLNFAVQRTIDRIIFLRIAEARGIEPEGNLLELARGRGVYGNLRVLFEQADQKYNSGLFHFHREKGREHPDELTLSLHVDDDTLRTIISRLYYPQSPYELSVLPVDILGQVYERFLGKVIRLTPGHRARVEEKPEVRKAGGVYYTPTYIVEYIVRHTVGRLLEGRDPDSAADLRLLDPACGSGSFLIGAYQYLLDWHLDWYAAHDPERHARRRPARVYRDESGEWRLTLDEKKRILLNAIYGVDIDAQAVEVTRLSLLLKVLEGERLDAAQQMALITTERLLPDLDSNIKCGNSLIGPDYYALNPQQLDMFDEEEMYRLNVFDWEQAFPAIMRRGGFDAVIGNPPWGSKTILRRQEVEYISSKYQRDIHNLNIFAPFIDLSVDHLLRVKGRLGFLIPKNFTKTEGYKEYRATLIEKHGIERIVDFGQFPGVAQEAIALFVICGGDSNMQLIERFYSEGSKLIQLDSLSVNDVKSDGFLVLTLARMPNLSSIVRRMEANSFVVREHFHVARGLEHGRNGNLLRCPACSKFFEKPGKTNKELSQVQCRFCGNWVRVDSKENNYTFISATRLQGDYQGLLTGNSIDRYTLRQVPFYVQLGLPGIDYKNLDKIAEKLLFIRISKTLRGYYDTDRLLCLNALNIVYSVEDTPYDLKYLLGVLNSRLLAAYVEFKITGGANLTIRLSNAIMRSLPVPRIDFSNPADVARHDHMVALVERMLDLHRRLNAARTPQDKEVLQHQIDATDRQIDVLVYELYGLTADEIAIVEAAATR